jgi:hypothetical protein
MSFLVNLSMYYNIKIVQERENINISHFSQAYDTCLQIINELKQIKSH